MLAWHLVLELLLLGSCTGFLAGLLGVGGGMLLVPFITLLLTSKGFPSALVVKIAVATSLATICFTSISSVRAHQARGAVRWDIVRMLAPGIVVGSLLGAQVAKALPAALLAGLFAAFVSFSATQMLRGRKPRPSRQLPGAPGMLGVGSAIGTVSSLVGAGGAFMSVPFMSSCNVPIHTAVATSAAIGVPIALAGTLGYVIAGWSLQDLPPGTFGFIYLPALLVVSTTSVLTAPLGARAAHALDVRQLRRVFALMLYAIAGYMFWRAVQA
ncbi:sulfite exporter TauE/SafE family protein [Methylibium sp.]|uniref:sulfite exporter TauE/SafE family protein n=1 Tax=Methylibium sp. TaxID=2067992 RepID=UPI003D09FF28